MMTIGTFYSTFGFWFFWCVYELALCHDKCHTKVQSSLEWMRLQFRQDILGRTQDKHLHDSAL